MKNKEIDKENIDLEELYSEHIVNLLEFIKTNIRTIRSTESTRVLAHDIAVIRRLLINHLSKIEKRKREKERFKQMNNFKFTVNMTNDLNILLDKKLLESFNNKPNFKNQYHAIALFELWNSKYKIENYKVRKNKIIADNVFIKGKQVEFTNARRRYKTAYQKEILSILPHLKS